MKNSLILLALTLSPNVDALIQERVQGAEIENLVGEGLYKRPIYKHPRPRRIRERMPSPFGKYITTTEMYVLHSEGVEGAIRNAGIAYGFDRNPEDGKNLAEYEFLIRECDKDKKLKVYAVYDVPHKLLYVDSSRDGYIDSVVKGIDSILSAHLPMIPTRCGKEE